MNKTTKIFIFALIIVLVLLGLFAMPRMNSEKDNMNMDTSNSTDISASIEKDLNAVDQDQFSDDFKDIDKDIQGL